MFYDQMVCLVGENPLPVYLGIRQFVHPENYNQVYLIHSGNRAGNVDQSTGTAGVAQRIARAYDDKPRLITLGDPYSPLAVKDVLASIFQQSQVRKTVALNYTGGTKVMSALAILAWNQICGNIDRTIYLQENVGLFRLGDGSQKELHVRLTMDVLANLHNTSPKYAGAFPVCTFADVQKVFDAWGHSLLPYLNYKYFYEEDIKGKIQKKQQWWTSLNEGQQFKMLQNQYNRPTQQWIGKEWNSCLELLTPETRDLWKKADLATSGNQYKGNPPKGIAPSDVCKQFRFFANNSWMEMLTLSIIKSLPNELVAFSRENVGFVPDDPLVPLDYIRAGQHYSVQHQEFESDIVMFVNHRLKYVSVTISQGEDTVKEKAFEAFYRAKQIGGGLASYCVVCLANADVVEKCNKSLNTSRSDSRDKIFGLMDLQRWLDGDASSLYNFLTQ